MILQIELDEKTATKLAEIASFVGLSTSDIAAGYIKKAVFEKEMLAAGTAGIPISSIELPVNKFIKACKRHRIHQTSISTYMQVSQATVSRFLKGDKNNFLYSSIEDDVDVDEALRDLFLSKYISIISPKMTPENHSQLEQISESSPHAYFLLGFAGYLYAKKKSKSIAQIIDSLQRLNSTFSYLHFPDMDVDKISDFLDYFYEQFL